AAARLAAEQEVENLSGLSPNPEKDIFVVRENRTTCLMAEFAAKFIVPYDVWASNYVDVSGGVGSGSGSGLRAGAGSRSGVRVWVRDPGHGLAACNLMGEEGGTRTKPRWRQVSPLEEAGGRPHLSPVSALWAAGKHTASSHRLSALVTPAGKSYECQAQQTISLVSSDHQKSVELLLSEVRVQPFDISADFVFSEEHKCPVDQREQLEETLPLILGLILGLVIVITLCVYHIHHKLTANQVQIPRDRSQYKHMG
ncbi:Lysosome-associated membrane glycoprotein 5, partial [Struthio camelus australis]